MRRRGRGGGDFPIDLSNKTVEIRVRDLDGLLRARLSHLDGKRRRGLCDVVGGLSLLLAAMAVGDLRGIGVVEGVARLAFVAVALVLVFLGGRDVFEGLRNPYSIERLEKDIIGLDAATYPQALAVVRDTFNDYPNRFLVFLCPRWECPLLPCLDLAGSKDPGGESDRMREKLSLDLNIRKSSIGAAYLGSRDSMKFSPPHDIEKKYEFHYYEVTIGCFPDFMRERSFTVKGKEYSWMTIDDMLADDSMMRRNRDVVDFLRKGLI